MAAVAPHRLLVAALTLALLASTGCTLSPSAPEPTGAACRPDPFTPDVIALLNAYGAERHHLTVAAFDDRDGCWYSFRSEQRVSTASVIKVEIMAGVLLRAQNAGRDLTASERSKIAPMIRNSDNATASSLWSSLGGEPGLESIGAQLELTSTDEVGPIWGLSTTTARDQAQFLSRLIRGPGVLNDSGRAQAWEYLTDINPTQRWGITAGVPEGWTVAQKNGFAGSKCCGWRVNSVGYVADPAGGGYSIAVLSDRWPNQAAGVPLVEAASLLVAGTLTPTNQR